MPGTAWKRSLKRPEMYEALKREGYSKQSAARISNAAARKKAVHSEIKRMGGK